MAVPSYRNFIEPVLRYLASRSAAVAVGDVQEAAARALELDEHDRIARVSSGVAVYKNRAGWALNALKHAGFAVAPTRGTWELTAAGREFARATPTLTEDQVSRLATLEFGSSQQGEERRATSHGKPRNVENSHRGDRKAYRLPARPLCQGGQAEVYEATRKSDGKIFILKRVRGKSGEPRMRREIEIQSIIVHENVMPILDWDATDFTWYVMPKGRRVMSELDRPVEFSLLLTIVDAVASALEEAHRRGHPHRDVKPHNIIDLGDENTPSRWVLADWGLTRRPLGETATALTRTGHILGTDGFAPPEAYLDSHRYGEAGDIFALGQVIAWACGAMPVPHVSGTAPSPWRELVESMTQLDQGVRIRSVAEVRNRLAILRSVGSDSA